MTLSVTEIMSRLAIQLTKLESVIVSTLAYVEKYYSGWLYKHAYFDQTPNV